MPQTPAGNAGSQARDVWSPAEVRQGLWRVYANSLPRFVLPEGILARSVQRTPEGWVRSEPCALNTAEALKAAFLLESLGVAVHDLNARELLDRMVAEHIGTADYQVVALTLWAASVGGSRHAEPLYQRLAQHIPRDATQSVPLASALSAVCAHADTAHTQESTRSFADQLARRILSNQVPGTGLFHSSARRIGLLRRRNPATLLSSQIYPIHALSQYAVVFSARDVLPKVQACADRRGDLQGSDGQWWRHYDARRGVVTSGYPVYAVNQDAAVPAALSALQSALGDRRYDERIERGLRWESGANELRETLVDVGGGFVARAMEQEGGSYRLTWEMFAYQPARCLFALASDPVWLREVAA